jgi:hypothetical protein
VTRRKTGPTEAVVDIIKARAQGMCECCNLWPGEQAHHLLPRRAGGTRRPEINLPSNLIWVYSLCHLAIERNRTASLKDGLLRSDGVNQFRKPVRLWHGLVRLDDEGGWEKLPSFTHTAGCAVWTSNNPCDCEERS